MAIPLAIFGVIATQAFPVVAVLGEWGRHPPAPFRQLGIFSAVCLLSDIAMIVVAMLAGNNHWLPWVTEPIEVGLTLWLLGYWQSPRGRRLYQIAIGVLAAWTVVMLVVLPWGSFDRWIGPVLSLAALGGALHTLVARSFQSRALLPSQDWFWICGGLAFFWVGYVPVDAFIMTVLQAHADWALVAVYIRASLLPVSFGLMTWGVLCPRFQAA